MNRMEAMFEKMMPAFMKFSNSKIITALKDGFVLTIPLSLLGSIFLLLANIPINGYSDFMAGIFGADWATPLNQVTGATMDILAIVAVFGIAYSYVKAHNFEAVAPGILGIVSFLIITNAFVVSSTGEIVTGVIPKTWTGGQGMITSIIVGLLVGATYSWFLKKDIRFKMPDSVPEGVSNAFTALIPGFFIMAGSMLVYIAADVFQGVSFTEIIYEILQIPLQNLSDTLPGILIIVLITSVLWWFGIHGANVVGGIMTPILTANALANQAVLDAGQALEVGSNAKIVTIQFLDVFCKFGGSGITIGLVIAALLVAKSEQMRALSKMSIVPGCFNINEPIIFGLPIVYNPMMLIPFIVVPILAALITYFSIASGFMPIFTGVQVPWTTPPVIAGFILAGWQGALVQGSILLVSIAAYFPFVKILDKMNLQQEGSSVDEINVAEEGIHVVSE